MQWVVSSYPLRVLEAEAVSTKQEVADRVSAYLQHGGLLESIVASDIHWHWRYLQCNPDVRFGPMLDHVIDEHIQAYKLKGIINRSEVARIVDKLVHGG